MVAVGLAVSAAVDVLIGRAIYRMIWRRGFRRALAGSALAQSDVDDVRERLAPYTLAGKGGAVEHPA